MAQSGFPLLSQAATILPVVRSYLVQAASRCRLPAGFSVDMVPILEEDLFGYELTPMGVGETCLTLGCKSDGGPVLRKESLAEGVPAAPRLATVDGRAVAAGPVASLTRARRREMRFPDWRSAAKSACEELETLFPGAPRRPPLINPGRNVSLERALLAVASRLAEWNPIIHFCGLPNEEQLGYALCGANGARGELVFRNPDQWTLNWRSPRELVRETWSVVAPDRPLIRHGEATLGPRGTRCRPAVVTVLPR